MRRGARGAGPLVAIVGLLVLSGCTVTGEAILGPDSITVDLRVEHAAPFSSGEGYIRSGPCDSRGLVGLEPTQLLAPRGRRACTLTGTLPLSADGAESPSLTQFFVTRTADSVIVRIPPGWPGDPRSEDLEAIDVRVHLPGEVVTSNANDFGALGNELRWTNPDTVSAEGLAAVSRVGGVPSWVLPTAIGLLAGAGAVWVGARVRRRPAAREATAQDVDAAASGAGDPGGPGPGPPEDPSVWAPRE